MNLEISLEPTPNPNALKFILNQDVKNEGKSTYKRPMDCEHNPLALSLFFVRGVDQVHFFKNVITITKFSFEEWEDVEIGVRKTLEAKFSEHDPAYTDPNPEEERRKNLTPDLQQIENILDKTIRPGLQGDGGDLECLSYEDNVLVIKYQGACGTCPSSQSGTLEAIKGILREEYNPHIEVYALPSEGGF